MGKTAAKKAEDKRKREKEIKTKKYSLMSNVIYIYRQFMEDHGWKQTSFVLIFPVLSVITDSFNVVLPAIVVSLIVHKSGIPTYVLAGMGVILLYILLSIIQRSCARYYDNRSTKTRCYSFLWMLIQKTLTSDYANWESHRGQKKMGMAAEALQGNYYGIERVFKEGFDLVGEILRGCSSMEAQLSWWI